MIPPQCWFTGKSRLLPGPYFVPLNHEGQTFLQRDLSNKTEVDLFWLGFGV